MEQEETPPIVDETQSNHGFPKSVTGVSQLASLESAGVSETEAKDLSLSFKMQSN